MSKIIRTPEDNLARLQEEAAAMEAAVPLTQAAHSKAKRARERAQGEREAALKRVRALSICASDETFNQLQSEFMQSAARVSELMRAEHQAGEAVDLARWAAEEALDDVRLEQSAILYERSRRFRDVAEAERRAISEAAEEFRMQWEASGHTDRMAYQLGMILTFEPTIQDLGWTEAMPMPEV
eukprot:6267285-Prymnesium_polylepis.1